MAPAQAHAAAVRLGAIVQRVTGPLPTDSRCLVQSLVLLRLLTRRSIDTVIVLGVQVEGGMKMQISRMAPPSPGRMQACIWLSLDARLGKLAGTITLPCLVVTSIAEGAEA